MKEYKFERLPAAEAREIYPAVWETARAALPKLDDEDLAVVVSLAVNTCNYCHEQSRPCNCSMDD